MAGQEESQSTPALIHIPESTSGLPLVGGGSSEMGAVGGGGDPLAGVPENNLRESCTRLSISLEENGLYKVNIVLDAYLFFPFIECDTSFQVFFLLLCVRFHMHIFPTWILDTDLHLILYMSIQIWEQ